MLQLSVDDYQVGWICALPCEYAAAKAMLDEPHQMVSGQDRNDTNSYTLGRIRNHNVVIACLPAGVDGTNAAATAATDLARTFRSLRFGLMVGIGGGIPTRQRDIRLGDVAVCQPSGRECGVVQYDKGKSLGHEEFERKGQLNKPPTVLLTALSNLQAEHQIEDSQMSFYLEQVLAHRPRMRQLGYTFPAQEMDVLRCSCSAVRDTSCEYCEDGLVKREARESTDPAVHYGIIASGNQVIKNAAHRDQIRDVCGGAICIEMEAAGLMDNFPCLVIRGICDYADSMKNDKWHNYAAASAAAFAKELLSYISVEQTAYEQPIRNILGQIEVTLRESVQVSKDILEENRIQSKKSEIREQTQRERECHQAFKTSPYERYKDINQDRATGTCCWVLDHPYFQRWYGSPINDLLWISADPGCGKSVLSRSLIEHELSAAQHNTTCYYFFKDNEQQDRLGPALCAVLHQLFSDQPHLLKYAIPPWEENGVRIREEVEIMWQILLDATSDKTARPVVCVLDALDECSDNDRRELITRLCSFYEQPSKTPDRAAVKFLVTSRPYDSVQRWFEQTTSRLPQIQLRGEEENDRIHQEINLVIDQRLQDLAMEFQLSTQHQEVLRQRLHSMEHRTYLWLYLAMDDIRNRYRDSPDPEEEPIDDLPSSVEDAYEQILQKITERQRPHARKILIIIVGSRRPLTIDEASIAFNAATAYEKDHLLIKEANVSHLKRHIREWCGLFVFISDSQLFLIHQTAKEFLFSKTTSYSVQTGLWKSSLSTAQVDLEMAALCATYLYLTPKTQLSPFKIFQDRGAAVSFFEYCAENWTSHLMDCDIIEHKKLFDIILKLYDTTGKYFHSWFPIFWGKEYYDHLVPRVYDQHAIAMHGHAVILAERYARAKFDLNTRDSTDSTALVWGARRGHAEVVKMLIERGADINIQGGREGDALQAASSAGHEDIVRILLDKGADFNHKGFYGDALQVASQHGHEKVVQILLGRGADANAQGGYYGNALQAASRNGHEKVVQILLNRGASVNAQGGEYGNALRAASLGDHEKIIQRLLDRGAEINAAGKEHGTALQAAASADGLEKVVQLLLDSGADVNAQGGEYCNALQAASRNGRTKVVQILLDRGASVNAQGGRYGNALQAAALNYVSSIVRLLLDSGADVNAQGGRYGNALQAASSNGYEEIVQMLLDSGADVNAQGGRYGNALQAASNYGDRRIVKMLLNRGADVNAQGGRYSNALQAASSNGLDDIVQVLLDAGATYPASGVEK